MPQNKNGCFKQLKPTWKALVIVYVTKYGKPNQEICVTTLTGQFNVPTEVQRPPDNETNDIILNCIQHTSAHYGMMNSQTGEQKTGNCPPIANMMITFKMIYGIESRSLENFIMLAQKNYVKYVNNIFTSYCH